MLLNAWRRGRAPQRYVVRLVVAVGGHYAALGLQSGCIRNHARPLYTRSR